MTANKVFELYLKTTSIVEQLLLFDDEQVQSSEKDDRGQNYDLVIVVKYISIYQHHNRTNLQKRESLLFELTGNAYRAVTCY